MLNHQPVLLSPALKGLNLQPNGIYVDCTFGRGGHTRAILEQLDQSSRVLAFDQDPDAVQAAQSLVDSRFTIIHSNFADLTKHITGKVNGIFLDLGVSSPQLDDSSRGFSFMRDGPLDMRMNPSEGISVGEWLSEAKMEEIAEVLKTYGEERHARRIARAIVSAREETELKTTVQLANLIRAVYPKSRKPELKHPATRSFQALRIFINRELEQLQTLLDQVLEVLAPGGRLVIISFHSLEDRIVKRFIRDCVRGDDFPPDLPIMAEALRPTLRSIGKPIFPDETEINDNPRSRSAIMRIAERTSYLI
jgi:16S rRNA (cytosine1402-N4)-methyltransferase